MCPMYVHMYMIQNECSFKDKYSLFPLFEIPRPQLSANDFLEVIGFLLLFHCFSLACKFLDREHSRNRQEVKLLVDSQQKEFQSS